MSNLMIYLIFNINNIEIGLVILSIILAIIGGVLIFAIADMDCLFPTENDDEETIIGRRVMKIILISSLLMFVIAMVLPTKETLIAMQVKNLATLENYNWTVEQLKGVVDYIVESINKIGR